MLFQCINILWGVGFGIGFTTAVSTVESMHESKFWYTIAYTTCNVNHYIIGDLIEDLIFRDLGVLGGIWHNWPTYGAPLLVLIEIFALEHVCSKHSRGAFRDPKVGVYHMIAKQGKTPLLWP